jgi:hypothetical protein
VWKYNTPLTIWCFHVVGWCVWMLCIMMRTTFSSWIWLTFVMSNMLHSFWIHVVQVYRCCDGVGDWMMKFKRKILWHLTRKMSWMRVNGSWWLPATKIDFLKNYVSLVMIKQILLFFLLASCSEERYLETWTEESLQNWFVGQYRTDLWVNTNPWGGQECGKGVAFGSPMLSGVS